MDSFEKDLDALESSKKEFFDEAIPTIEKMLESCENDADYPDDFDDGKTSPPAVARRHVSHAKKLPPLKLGCPRSGGSSWKREKEIPEELPDIMGVKTMMAKNSLRT